MLRLIIVLICATSFGFAQQLRDDIKPLQQIGVDENLAAKIPLSIPVTDEFGTKKELKSYFNKGKPVLFTFAYYDCPMLCTQVLQAMASSVRKMDWESSDRYQVVTVSIDVRDSADVAQKKKKFYLAEIEDPDIHKNWTFLTAPQATIDTLTKAFGVKYFYDEKRDEFAHPAVVFTLSPEGKITRYLYGLNYEPKDLKLALLEASEGRVGSTLEKLILYCFHYDSTANTYVLFARNLMKLGGAVTLLLLSIFLVYFWMKDRRKRNISVP